MGLHTVPSTGFTNVDLLNVHQPGPTAEIEYYPTSRQVLVDALSLPVLSCKVMVDLVSLVKASRNPNHIFGTA